jgi:hypothetical protein
VEIMMERSLAPILVFAVLVGGSYGVAREWISPRAATLARAPAAVVVTLPPVEVIGRRDPGQPARGRWSQRPQ